MSDIDGFEVTAFSGPVTFMHRPWTRDLTGVDIAVLGVPYDMGTTNRAGTRNGPRAVREMSLLAGEFPWGLWPWDFNVFDKVTVIDHGDVPIHPGYPARLIDDVGAQAGRILDAGAGVLALGGDHYISYPLLKAHARVHGPLSLVHFDAHSDTWRMDDHNHGSMFFHAAQEGLIDPARSIQLGMRTPNPESHGFTVRDARHVLDATPEALAAEIRAVVGDHPVYLTFDIDFLDPAFAPGTGTPVIGGPTTDFARRILHALAGLNVVGGDQVEVAPAYDGPGQITALAGATLAGDILHLMALAREKRTA